jgi:hypothetical protein
MPLITNPKPSSFRHTAKQQEMMDIILKAADTGELIYLAELNRRISWGPVDKTCLSSCVRFLEAHGFVKRLYGPRYDKNPDVRKLISYAGGDHSKVRGMVQYIVPTPAAYPIFRPKRLRLEI